MAEVLRPSFLQLPIDVFKILFEHLEPVHLAQLEKVCRHMHEVITFQAWCPVGILPRTSVSQKAAAKRVKVFVQLLRDEEYYTPDNVMEELVNIYEMDINEHKCFSHAVMLERSAIKRIRNGSMLLGAAYLASGKRCAAAKLLNQSVRKNEPHAHRIWSVMGLYGHTREVQLPEQPGVEELSKAMICAAAGNNVTMIKLLVDRKITFGSGPFNAINMAARFGSLDVIRYFHEQRISLRTPDDYGERLPIEEAIAYGHASVVEFLIRCGAHIAETGPKPLLLERALDSRDLAMITLIFRSYPDLITGEERSYDKLTAMDIAIEAKWKELVEIIENRPQPETSRRREF